MPDTTTDPAEAHDLVAAALAVDGAIKVIYRRCDQLLTVEDGLVFHAAKEIQENAELLERHIATLRQERDRAVARARRAEQFLDYSGEMDRFRELCRIVDGDLDDATDRPADGGEDSE